MNDYLYLSISDGVNIITIITLGFFSLSIEVGSLSSQGGIIYICYVWCETRGL